MYTVYNRLELIQDWTLLAKRTEFMPAQPFGMVQNAYRTYTLQYQLIYDFIWFWEIILNGSFIVIFLVIYANYELEFLWILYKVNSYKPAFAVNISCMYTCMNLSCTLSCEHVECVYLLCDNTSI